MGLTELFEHNLWANLALVDACAGLSPEQLDGKPEDGVYGAIGETLHHIANAEGRYVWRIKGSPDVAPPSENEGLPGIEEIRRKLEASGGELIRLAEEVPDDKELTASYQGKDYRYTAGLVKLQAINHATDHRSQIATLLTRLGIEPPDTDGWTFGTATGVMTSS